MMKRGISTLALTAMIFPVGGVAHAQNAGWNIVPPGASPGVIHRPSNDPLAIAAASAMNATRQAMSANIPSAEVVDSTPVIGTEDAVVVPSSNVAPQVLFEAPLPPQSEAALERKDQQFRLDDDPDLPLMSREEVEAKKAEVFKVLEASVRPPEKPLVGGEAVERAFAGTPWGFEPSMPYMILDAGLPVKGHFTVADAGPSEDFVMESVKVAARLEAVRVASLPPIMVPAGPLDAIRMDLLARYASADSDYESDLRRLRDIASMPIESLDDISAGAVSFSDEAPVAQEQQAQIGTSGALAEMIAIRDQQIQQMQMAIASGYAPYPSPQQQIMAQAPAGLVLGSPAANYPALPSQEVQAPLDGIPSLDYRGELPAAMAISASDVPDGSSPFAPAETAGAQGMVPTMPAQAGQPYVDPNMIAGMMAAYGMGQAQQPSAPVSVGDGHNLLLQGWKLGMTGSGQIGMYLEGDPNSVIELSKGMVVGSIGRVTDVAREGEEIVARFESGDEIRSPVGMVRLMDTGATNEDGNSF